MKRITETHLAQQLKKSKLKVTHSRMRFLLILRDLHEDRVSISAVELVKAMKVTANPRTVYRILIDFEKVGLILRVAHPKNKKKAGLYFLNLLL